MSQQIQQWQATFTQDQDQGNWSISIMKFTIWAQKNSIKVSISVLLSCRWFLIILFFIHFVIWQLLVWDQSILSCMYKAQTNAPSAGMTTPANMLTTAPVGGATPQPASGGNPQQLTNPCTQQAIANNQLYFPFPGDDSSYIQVTFEISTLLIWLFGK